jgi:hypothetical protein
MLTGRRLSNLLPDACLDLPDRVRDLLQNPNIGLSGDAIDVLAKALEFDPTKRPHVAGYLAKILVEDMDANSRRSG